ncbi:MAG: hypothetical protein FH758_09290 [Firmicutes bacterium]|nr:hypothetical protein [Bacillota bacterium]
MSEKPFPELLLIKPLYIEGSGDGTQIVSNEGDSIEDLRGMRSVRTALCRQYAVDYPALRKMCIELCGPGITPLLLAPGYTMIPVKTRTAMFPGDPCHGYVNLAEVKDIMSIDDGEYKAELETNNGSSFKTLTSAKTVTQNLRRAELLQKCRWPMDVSHLRQRRELVELILKAFS